MAPWLCMVSLNRSRCSSIWTRIQSRASAQSSTPSAATIRSMSPARKGLAGSRRAVKICSFDWKWY